VQSIIDMHKYYLKCLPILAYTILLPNPLLYTNNNRISVLSYLKKNKNQFLLHAVVSVKINYNKNNAQFESSLLCIYQLDARLSVLANLFHLVSVLFIFSKTYYVTSKVIYFQITLYRNQLPLVSQLWKSLYCISCIIISINSL